MKEVELNFKKFSFLDMFNMEERDYLKNIPKIAQDFSLLDNIAVMAL
jgi:hypothetical protein